MREIKFRGLNSKGHMVYGYLVPDIAGSTVYYADYSQRICWHDGNAHCNQPVKNGTVGQFTGLTDCNGVEIYEWDIIEDEEHFYSIIAWNDKCLSWFAGGEHLGDYDSVMIKVIGNIHQNPELLK